MGGAVTAVALAGCTSLVNSLAGMVLQDVNVFNETDRRIAGSITVDTPGGETVLETEFDLDGDDPDSEEETDSLAVYEDVFADAGAYTVALRLAEGTEIDGMSATTETVSVTTPADEHIVVGLGASETADPIAIHVIEERSDLQDVDTS